MKASTPLVTVLMMLISFTIPSFWKEVLLDLVNLTRPIIAASQAEKNLVERSELATEKSPVELEFIEWRGSKPPLKYLVLNMTLRNDSDENRWFILPYQLTR